MSRMSYEETMAWGADQYRDVIDTLNAEGLPATFIQTGGMNAGIEVQLKTGDTLLITDGEDSLAWVRADHEGWWVGLTQAGDHTDGPLRYGQVADGGVSALLALVREVLFNASSSNRPTSP